MISWTEYRDSDHLAHIWNNSDTHLVSILPSTRWFLVRMLHIYAHHVCTPVLCTYWLYRLCILGCLKKNLCHTKHVNISTSRHTYTFTELNQPVVYLCQVNLLGLSCCKLSSSFFCIMSYFNLTVAHSNITLLLKLQIHAVLTLKLLNRIVNDPWCLEFVY